MSMQGYHVVMWEKVKPYLRGEFLKFSGSVKIIEDSSELCSTNVLKSFIFVFKLHKTVKNVEI